MEETKQDGDGCYWRVAGSGEREKKTGMGTVGGLTV